MTQTMISLVEALNFRCLQYVRQPLAPFHVLVGPNASGKTTFLDVVRFLGDVVSDGLEAAIRKRTPDPRDLLFGKEGTGFELAVEAPILDRHLEELPQEYNRIRYELAVSIDSDTSEPTIQSEYVKFVTHDDEQPRERLLFPEFPCPPKTIFYPSKQGTKSILSKNAKSGKDNFYPEIKRGKGGGWMPTFQLGPHRSAFANLPEDETRFPVSTWFKGILSEGTQAIVLDSLAMRHASPPGQARHFKSDGSNLPWVVEDLKSRSPDQFRDWISHLRTALPDLEDIRTVERPDDRHRYLVLHYANDLDVPSWTASDGTLRLLALTLPAYLPDLDGVFLIEEPENGIHPRAVETMFQSLSNVYGAQVLMASHSPVILSIAEANQVLCFAKDENGATDIVIGSEHPALVDWQGETNLGMLFAAGVLG